MHPLAKISTRSLGRRLSLVSIGKTANSAYPQIAIVQPGFYTSKSQSGPDRGRLASKEVDFFSSLFPDTLPVFNACEAGEKADRPYQNLNNVVLSIVVLSSCVRSVENSTMGGIDLYQAQREKWVVSDELSDFSSGDPDHKLAFPRFHYLDLNISNASHFYLAEKKLAQPICQQLLH